VRRTKDAFVVEAAVAGLDPKQFDVRVTLTELLLTADVHHSDREQDSEVVLCEFVNGPLFRSYKFPEPMTRRWFRSSTETGRSLSWLPWRIQRQRSRFKPHRL
jgi:HSP20 family molecular chaperone IbpA